MSTSAPEGRQGISLAAAAGAVVFTLLGIGALLLAAGLGALFLLGFAASIGELIVSWTPEAAAASCASGWIVASMLLYVRWSKRAASGWGLAIAVIPCFLFLLLVAMRDDAVGLIVFGVLIMHSMFVIGPRLIRWSDQLTSPDSRRRKRLAKGECPNCQYPMRGLSEPRCPECGERWTLAEIHAAVQERLS